MVDERGARDGDLRRAVAQIDPVEQDVFDAGTLAFEQMTERRRKLLQHHEPSRRGLRR